MENRSSTNGSEYDQIIIPNKSNEIKTEVKIDQKFVYKTSRHKKDVKNVCYDNFGILCFDDCKELSLVKEKIEEIEFSKFKSLFIFIIRVEKGSDNEIRYIFDKITKSFEKERPILIEYLNELISEQPQYYYGIRSVEGYWKNPFDLKENFLKVLVEREGILNDFITNSIYALKSDGILDTDWNFVSEIFFGTNASIEKSFEKCIDSFDKSSCYLMNLFFSNFHRKDAIKYSIKLHNYDAFLAFNNIPFTEDESEELKKRKNEAFSKHFREYLLEGIDNENTKVVDYLLHYTSTLNKKVFNFNLWCEALKKAFETENMNIFEKIKEKADDFKNKKQEFLRKFDEQIEEIDKLHDYIKNENINEIKKFCKDFPNFKRCEGNKKKCALEWALENEKFEIYSLLIANGFQSNDNRKISVILNDLHPDYKELILCENIKHLKEDENNHIGVLKASCFVKSNRSNLPFNEIQRMLEKINKIEEIRYLMKAASYSFVKINFDLDEKHIHRFDPSSHETTMGINYFKDDLIIVGRNVDEISRFATFGHELCHYVLYITYENECLPYCDGDTKREGEWEEIVKNYRKKYEEKSINEEIVSGAFKYYESKDFAPELIVRVPHLLIQYINEPNDIKIKELEREFPEMFKFYRDYVHFELKIADGFELRRLNKDFGLLSKIKNNECKVNPDSSKTFLSKIENSMKIIIKTEQPSITFSIIYNEIFKLEDRKLNASTSNIYISYDKLVEYNKERNKFSYLFNSKTIKRMIIDASNIDEIKLQSKDYKPHICYIFVVSKNFNSIQMESKFKIIDHELGWKDLHVETKQKLLKKSFIYQEKEINLSKILNSYLQTEKFMTSKALEYLLAHEKTEINKIYFNGVDPYISRKFKRNGIESIIDELIKKMSDNSIKEIVLIADFPGSGKTITSKYILKRLITLKQTEWFSFIDLRDITEKLEKLTEDDFKIQDLKIILNIQNPLENVIFDYLHEKKKITLCFDGFDEIKLKFRQTIIKIFNKLKIMDNIKNIIINVRSKFKDELEGPLNIKSYNLVEITEKEQIDFLKEQWNYDNSDTLAKHLITQLTNILKDNGTDSDTVSLPLQLRIIAEVHKNFKELSTPDLRKISLNFPILYSDYIQSRSEKLLKFNDKIHENFVNKSYLNAQNLKQIFFYHAFKNFGITPITKGLKHYENDWPLEEVEKCGILWPEKEQKIHFLHRTFPEYLISDYIIHEINYCITKETSLPEHSQELLLNIFNNFEKFKSTGMFLNGMLFEIKHAIKIHLLSEKLEENITASLISCAKKQYFGSCVFLLKSIKYFNNEIIYKIITFKDDNGRNFFLNAAVVVTQQSEQLFLSLIKEMMENEKFKGILFEKDDNGNTFFHSFVQAPIKGFVFQWIWNEIKMNEQMKSILSTTNNLNKTCIHYAIETYTGDLVTVNAIFKSISKLKIKDQKMIFEIKDSENMNIFHQCVLKDNHIFNKVFNCLLDLYQDNVKISRIQQNSSDASFFHIPQEYDDKIKIFNIIDEEMLKNEKMNDRFREYLLSRNKSNENVLQICSSNSNENHIFRFLWLLFLKFTEKKDFRNIIIEKNLKKRNIILKLAQYGTESNINFAWKEINQLFNEKEIVQKLFNEEAETKNKNLVSFILQSTCNPNYKSFEFHWELFEKNNENIAAQKSALKMVDTKGNNFLHHFMYFGKKEYFEMILNKLKKLFDYQQNKNDLKEFLLLKGNNNNNLLTFAALNSENCEMVKNLWELLKEQTNESNNLLIDTNKDSSNVFHISAKYSMSNILKFLFEKVKECFEYDRKKISKYLLQEDKKKINALKYAASNDKDPRVFEILWDIYEEYVDKDSFKNFLTSIDSNNNNLLSILAYKGVIQNIKYLWERIGKYLDEDERGKLLKSKGFENRNLLSRCALNDDKEVFKYVWELYERHFKTEPRKTLIEMIQECDDKKYNVFHLAVALTSKENVIFVWNNIVKLLEPDERNVKDYLNIQNDPNVLKVALTQAKDKNTFIWVYNLVESYIETNEMNLMIENLFDSMQEIRIRVKFESNKNFLIKKHDSIV